MSSAASRIGLVAGWGTFPLVVARELSAQGKQVVCVGIADHADPQLREICYAYRTVGIGKLGAAVRFLQRHHVQIATMSGKIHKVRFFQRSAWYHMLPDLYGLRTFFPHFITKSQDCKDDTLLGATVRAFARREITMAPATELVPSLLARAGSLGNGRLSPGHWKDIAFGWRLAREMGRLDVGQSVAVKGQAVLAVEAVEGTDECILRAGQLCPAGGFTVVKIAKPRQDMRFDVPTIGIGTIQSLHRAGGKVLAIEADRTIVLDAPRVASLALELGIHVVALSEAEVLDRAA